MRPMSTAPKDDQILLDVGLPWPVVGCWNDANSEWVYASYAAGTYEGKTDSYYETEYERKPKGWMPMPNKIESVPTNGTTKPKG